MDWNFVNKAWDKWASNSVSSEGPLKSAVLINYDPTGPSRLLSTIGGELGTSIIASWKQYISNGFKVHYVTSSAEQEGMKADPIELSQFISFVKRNKLQTETFFIGQNEYMVTSIRESWFTARCMNTLKPTGEGAIVMQTSAFLLVGLYEGSIGAASRAIAAADQFVLQLGRKNL